jgi:hypothetical protein
MFQAKWKTDYIEEQMGYFSDLDIQFQERIAEEVNKGFDTRDEMNEVFREIADEFDVSPDHVWRTYYSGEWK